MVNPSQPAPFWPLLPMCTTRAHPSGAQREVATVAGSSWQRASSKTPSPCFKFHPAAHAGHALAISYDYDGKLQPASNEGIDFKVHLDSTFTVQCIFSLFVDQCIAYDFGRKLISEIA